MRIKMITLSAGPAGVMRPGEIYDVSAETAQALIAGHFAMPATAEALSSEPAGVADKPIETEIDSKLTAEKVFKPSPRRRG